MGYRCPMCREMIEGDITVFRNHTEDHIIDVIKNKNPGWVEEDGICPRCVEYFRKEMRGDSE